MNISLADSHSKIRRLLHLNLTYAYKLLRLCHAPSSLAVIETKIKYKQGCQHIVLWYFLQYALDDSIFMSNRWRRDCTISLRVKYLNDLFISLKYLFVVCYKIWLKFDLDALYFFLFASMQLHCYYDKMRACNTFIIGMKWKEAHHPSNRLSLYFFKRIGRY